MCGRFVLVEINGVMRWLHGFSETPDGWQIADLLDPPPVPRYNIAPTQNIVVVTNDDGVRRLEWMRWGLIPFWAKPGQKLPSSVNARDDRLASSGMWRGPLKRSRCLIPADGFYEWTGPRGAKQPVFIRAKEGRQFAFAGLSDTWESPDGPVRSCAIVTTGPNTLMEPIHNRMPAILDDEATALWLDPQTESADQLLPLVAPYPSELMEAFPVSKAVNSARNDRPELIQPLAASD